MTPDDETDFKQAEKLRICDHKYKDTDIKVSLNLFLMMYRQYFSSSNIRSNIFIPHSRLYNIVLVLYIYHHKRKPLCTRMSNLCAFDKLQCKIDYRLVSKMTPFPELLQNHKS